MSKRSSQTKTFFISSVLLSGLTGCLAPRDPETSTQAPPFMLPTMTPVPTPPVDSTAPAPVTGGGEMTPPVDTSLDVPPPEAPEAEPPLDDGDYGCARLSRLEGALLQ
jgi:hypothetical protein